MTGESHAPIPTQTKGPVGPSVVGAGPSVVGAGPSVVGAGGGAGPSPVIVMSAQALIFQNHLLTFTFGMNFAPFT